MKVIKRDGRKSNFDENKIINAIKLASNNTNGDKITDEQIKTVLLYVSSNLNDVEEIKVDTIHFLVEESLKKENKDVAKTYIEYRKNRDIERYKNLEITKKIFDKLKANNVQNQNANLDEYSFGGRKGEADSELMKELALNYLISPKFAKNHLNNRIYIHDLDSYAVGMHNCLSIPIDDLLKNGIKTRQVFIRPANSVNTAMQIVAITMQLQSLQQFGGVSVTHLDWTMIPYVRKSYYKYYNDGLKFICNKKKLELSKENIESTSIENNKIYKNKKVRIYALEMTKKEIHQACEGMLHNLNSLQSRSGNQLPFSSVNYGTCTLEEGRMIIREILECSIEGVGNHATSIFPCQIFQMMDGVNTKVGEPNYDLFKLAIECTSKRLYPNYVNCDWSNDVGYNKDDPRTYPSTMGCRTWNGTDINAEKEEYSHMKDGRGNIAPATIILPTLAMEAKKKSKDNESYIVDYFMDILEKAISDCKDELIERYNYICSQNPKSATFMYENNTFYGYKEDEGIKSALKHGTLAIGQIGLAETLQILVGCDHTEEKGMEVAKRIEQLFKDKCSEYKETYRLNFGVYFTPAENLVYTSMNKFKKKYGIIENVSDRDYFTNSIHVPVWKEISPFEKIDIESQLTSYSNAGCITYVEIGDNARNNLDALEQIVLYAKRKDIPYFALNLPLSHCKKCGCDENIGFGESCPRCNAGDDYIEHLARVTGYLSTDYKHFNKGKQSEVKDRYVHVNKLNDWKK